MKRILAVLILAALIAAPAFAEFKLKKLEQDPKWQIIESSTAVDFDTGKVVKTEGSIVAKTKARLEAEIVECDTKLAAAEAAYLSEKASLESQKAVKTEILDRMDEIENPVIIPDVNWDDIQDIAPDTNWTDLDVITP